MFNLTNRLVKYHTRRPLYIMFVSFLFGACGPTPWPDNFKQDLVQMYKDNPSHIVNLIVPSDKHYSLASCLLNQAKIDYPDYKDFQKEEDLKKGAYIDRATIDCISKIPNISFDNLIEAVTKTQNFKNNSENLSKEEIVEYMKVFKSELETRFNTIQNLLTLSISNEIDLMQVLSEIDSKCGENIMSQRMEKKNKLDKLNSLITYENGYGKITFVNRTGFRVFNIKLVYYYKGNSWSGWVSEGHWELENGETKTINIPLSIDGSIGHKLYYSARMYDNEDRLVTWNDNKGSFLTASETSKFRIPNAQSLEMLKLNDDFYLFKTFAEEDLGGRFFDSYFIGFSYNNNK